MTKIVLSIQATDAQDMYPVVAHTIFPSDGPVMKINRRWQDESHGGIKHRRDHHDVVNSFKIRLKTRREAVLFRSEASEFVVERTIECASVSDEVTKIVKTMVAKLIVHAAANIIAVSVLKIVLKMATFFDSIRVLTARSIEAIRVKCFLSWLVLSEGH